MVCISKLPCEKLLFGAICPPTVLGALWCVLQAALNTSPLGGSRVDSAAGSAGTLNVVQ